MATTFLQKLKLAFRGWQRRRDQVQQEFVRRNAAWGTPVATARAAHESAAGNAPVAIDRDGLQVAFLDESSQITYYYDTATGDVIDIRDGSSLAEPRYRRVPRRTAQSEQEDRRAFVAALPPSAIRARLEQCLDPAEFRQALSTDRALERAWFSFKNDRAIAAIEEWLRAIDR